jgi:hypothetical protein
MNYFENCNTIDDAKKLYYELAIKLHPDKNIDRDTTSMFQDLLNQFEAFRPGKEKYKNEAAEHRPKDYIYVINELIKIMHTSPGLLVSINGSFIWVSGNSYPVRAEIKAILRDGKTEKFPDQMLKVGFASKKQQWYFSPKSYKKRSKKVLSFDRIQDLYGNEDIKSQANDFQQKIFA